MVVCSAQAGDDCNSGLMVYAEGNHPKALKVFESTAKKGDACSQFQLGMMHFYGHGTKKDDKKAREWLQKAADKGFEKAQMMLARLKNP